MAKHSISNLPLAYKLKAARLMLLHGLTMGEGVRLFNKYVDGWGGKAKAWRFEAVKDGKVVATLEKKAADSVRLIARADHTDLSEGATYDMALVRIEAEDGAGNRLSYFQEPVELSVDGPIELVGPSIVSLKGGAFGALVRTKGLVGEARLTICSAQAGEAEIGFTVT